MSKHPVSEKLFVEGPVGRLEAVVERPGGGALEGCAIVCHPHPQHGGTMHNKVAHTLARAFVRSGFESLRFNFRGVGRSEGRFDCGIGELDDALAALRWLGGRHPDSPIWLAGFSFGAAIAVKAAAAGHVDGLVSVAPALGRLASGPEAQSQCPWLIVQGDEDELVDIAETVEWFDSLDPGPELLIVDGGEHFFHGRLGELREAVITFVTGD